MKDFREALDLHLKAIVERDIDAYKAFLSNEMPPILIFNSGKVMKGYDEIINFHVMWFQDTTWEMTFDIVDTVVMQESAYALLHYTSRDKDKNGVFCTSQSYLSLLFTLTKQGWILIRDQNTPISS